MEKERIGLKIDVNEKEKLQINAIKNKTDVTKIIVNLVKWFNKNPEKAIKEIH